jgi:chromosome segregation ATPase
LVQTTLIFLLGFLSAALIAIAAAPAIWRRAGDLMRQRIEASMPLTRNEVQADKDQQRAEFAIALRKLEIKSKSLQEKLTEQRADAAVHRETARVLEEGRKVQEAELVLRAEQLDGLNATLNDRENDIVSLGTVRTELETEIDGLKAGIEARDKTINDLQIDSDNRRIELVSKVTEQDQLNSRLREVNLTRKSLEEKLRLTMQEMRTIRETSRVEAKRLADLERKNERLVTQLSDRDERLERREKELLRIKDSLKIAADEQSALRKQILAINQRNLDLEREVAKAAQQSISATQGQGQNLVETAMKKLQDDKLRLIEMVRQLKQEKDSLVEKLKAANSAVGAPGNDDAKLRSQVFDLTAKVVAMTAESEGAKSPVTRLLHTAGQDAGQAALAAGASNEAPLELPESLADRIKNLQKSARGA